MHRRGLFILSQVRVMEMFEAVWITVLEVFEGFYNHSGPANV